MNNVAIYIRVSTEEQLKGFSIEGQLESLHAYSKEFKMTVFKVYVDAGLSGSSIEGRPALKELLRDAQDACFQTVLCWKLNRLSRNMKDLLTMLELFKKHDIAFKSITEQFQSDNPMGQFVMQMMGSVAELERKQISQNVRIAVKERNRQGKWNAGNIVLGYDWISHEDNKLSRTIINLKEAELVLHIFELYAKGYGFKAITNQLNQENYLTKKGKVFGIATVRYILKNVNYIGKIRCGKDEVIQGHHEPVVSEALWEVVQTILNNRSQPPLRTIERIHPLSRILKCPQCDHSMVPGHVNTKRKNGNRKTYFYYTCENYINKGSSICKPNLISADAIEQWFSDQLNQLVSQPYILNRIMDSITQKHKTLRNPQNTELKRLTVELHSMEEKRKRYFQLYEDGTQDKDTLIKNLEGLKELRKTNEESIQLIENNLEDINVPVIPLSKVKAALSHLWTVLSSANESQQKQLLRLMIEKITIPLDRNIEKAIIHTQATLMHMQFPIKLNLKGERIQ
jgi:site-specific DNA recombinase